ncbi:DNA cytosine methyltransferase [Microbacterium sp. zg-YB36]|uniref:DNA cytosine methyltransferase n=1 Tax=Microbacterium sp. zg-YB36 TaxID=2969407 RepID=UPI00214B0F91|nr:DNA cytosine methyltransferase [Microbacterium sp. zg-YB36]MDL5351121.1 DNA cytosine methyltransferase [Microbacterium sp. zg-YB36]
MNDNSRRDIGGHQTSVGLRAGMLPGVRVTIEEAAALQSYPADFKFAGTKGSIGLQIGNAVPPLLAKAILEELWS